MAIDEGVPLFKCTSDIIIETVSEYGPSLIADKNQSRGDFSVCGMSVVQLKGLNDSVNARALLDSGSGSNFISAELLPLLDYVKIGSSNLRLTGINSTQEDRCDLVKVQLSNEDCPVKSIKCYVRPGTFSDTLITLGV